MWYLFSDLKLGRNKIWAVVLFCLQGIRLSVVSVKARLNQSSIRLDSLLMRECFRSLAKNFARTILGRLLCLLSSFEHDCFSTA